MQEQDKKQKTDNQAENQKSRETGRAGTKAPNDKEAPATGAIESGEQHIELPKGGGALESIGEKFENNLFTGSGSVTIPVNLTQGREEFTPQLQLTYSSGGGNSPFGLGWNLSTATIKRKTSKGLPTYRDAEEKDTFIMAGAEDLVPCMEENSGQWQRKKYQEGEYDVLPYRPRTEENFSRIERWLHRGTGFSHWQVTDRENITRIYGRDASARISDPDNPQHIFKWCLQEKYDPKGNVIRYQYQKENTDNIDPALLHEKNRLKHGKAFNQTYLKRVLYGNSIPYDPEDSNFDDNVNWYFELVLDYGDHDENNPDSTPVQPMKVRKDPFSSFKSGFEIRTWRLCRRIMMFHHFEALSEAPYLVKSTELEYEETPVSSLLASVQHKFHKDGEAPAAYPSVTFDYTRPQIDDRLRTLNTDDLAELPGGIDGARFRWKDLYGEGIQGILAETSDGWYFKSNAGDQTYYKDLPPSQEPDPNPGFDPVKAVADKPATAGLQGKQRQLTDIDGDGGPELVVRDRQFSGYYDQDENGHWKSFHPFDNIPRVNFQDPNLKMIDLTNNGFPDILIATDYCYHWYPAGQGTEGHYAPLKTPRHHNEDDGPALLFADSTESIHLADMSGDGMTDLVRIRNGEAAYWPNIGYGYFGRKINMDNAPVFDHPELFDGSRIRLNDIDGNGTTDILYIGSKETAYWKNYSGNAWSGKQIITPFPGADDHTMISVTDIFGNGTSSLVWSSPLPNHDGLQVRYLMLSGRHKPNMLREMNNNMGGVQRFRYVPSTRFYLRDKRNQKPWITKLPFPVQVLERHETYNEVTGTRYVSRFAYHHGFYDPHEREFRGFGMAEQWDGENYEHFAAGGLFGAGASNEDEPSHVPPVHTKSWFHTGSFEKHYSLRQLYEKEFFDGDNDFKPPQPTTLPENLSANELREACRALKGKKLREEVFADDNTDKADKPYTVTEKSHHVSILQPQVEQAGYAVFQVVKLHAVNYEYDRVPDDPRISQRAVLKTDEFGNITRSAQIAYPRRGSGNEPEQEYMQVIFKDKTYINDTQNGKYFIGLPVEKKNYEMTGQNTPADGLYTRNELNNAFDNATEIPFEQEPSSGTEIRLFNRRRTTYYNDNADSERPLGQISFHGLVYRTYKMVLTEGLKNDIYNDDGVTRVDDNLLEDEGGYIKRDQLFWKPSERMVHMPSQFYLPEKVIDPFGNETALEYESNGLFVEKVTDPLGNERLAEFDYRVLAPWRVTGINGNRREVEFDVRGMVTAKAVRGKAGEGLGDTLSDPTEKYSYNLFNWKDNG